MSQEHSHLDISDRQLLGASPQPASVWTEIGEAQVTHTIFGRAKVRIIRKHDKLHRALWLTATLVVIAAAWQGWMAFQQTGPAQGTDSLSHESVEVHTTAPASQSESSAPVAPLIVESKPASPPQTEAGKPAFIARSAPQPARGMNDTGSAPASRPAAHKPSPAGLPQSAPVAAREPSMNETARQIPPRQPGTPYVGAPRTASPAAQPSRRSPAAVVAPRTPQRAIQPAASSPVAVAPPAATVDREDTSQPPAGAAPQPAQAGTQP